MVASLARKGFEFDMIKQVSKKVLSAEDAEKIDNMEWFYKKYKVII